MYNKKKLGLCTTGAIGKQPRDKSPDQDQGNVLFGERSSHRAEVLPAVETADAFVPSAFFDGNFTHVFTASFYLVNFRVFVVVGHIL